MLQHCLDATKRGPAYVGSESGPDVITNGPTLRRRQQLNQLEQGSVSKIHSPPS
jgi:hypothetical protein